MNGVLPAFVHRSTTLDLIVEQDGDVIVLIPHGDVDMYTVDLLSGAIAEIEGSSREPLVLDLRQLDFMDSTGLKAVLRAVRSFESDGRSITVLPGKRNVHKLFELTGAIESVPWGDPDHPGRTVSLTGTRYLGERVVEILGRGGAATLLEILNRTDEARARLIGRLFAREDTAALAAALIEIESDPEDQTRRRFIVGLEQVLA